MEILMKNISSGFQLSERGLWLLRFLFMLFLLLFVAEPIVLWVASRFALTLLSDVAPIFGSEYNEPGILFAVIGVIILLAIALEIVLILYRKSLWDTHICYMRFECCGAEGIDDWKDYLPIPPKTCCKDMSSQACVDRTFASVDDLYTTTCKGSVINWLKRIVITTGYIGIGLALYQVVGIGLTICLGLAVKHGQNKEEDKDEIIGSKVRGIYDTSMPEVAKERY